MVGIQLNCAVNTSKFGTGELVGRNIALDKANGQYASTVGIQIFGLVMPRDEVCN